MEAAVGAVRAYVTPIVVILGLLGNACILVIFILEARLSRWNRFGIYCVALAVSDSSILIFNGLLDDFLGRGLVFASGGRVVVKLDTISRFHCKMMEYSPHVFFFTSTYLLLAFSIDRLLTIYRPLQYISHHHIRSTVLLVIAIFVLGFVVMLPTVFIHEIEENESGVAGRKCNVVHVNSTQLSCAMLYFKSFGVFVLPFAVELVLSVVIVIKLLEIRRGRQDLLPTQPQEAQLEMSRFYAQLAVAAIYCIFVCPLCVVIILRVNCNPDASIDTEYYQLLGHLSRLLDSVKDVNYAVNFWIYLVFVRSFRQRFVRAMSYVFVRLKCNQLCPKLVTSQKAVQVVQDWNRKRRPTLFPMNTSPRMEHALNYSTAVNSDEEEDTAKDSSDKTFDSKISSSDKSAQPTSRLHEISRDADSHSHG